MKDYKRGSRNQESPRNCTETLKKLLKKKTFSKDHSKKNSRMSFGRTKVPRKHSTFTSTFSTCHALHDRLFCNFMQQNYKKESILTKKTHGKLKEILDGAGVAAAPPSPSPHPTYVYTSIHTLSGNTYTFQ